MSDSGRAPCRVTLAEVFERFTERARQVVVFAQEEARGLGHDHIGTEHILIGLLREEQGVAARVLDAMGVTLEDVRAEVLRVTGRGDSPATGQIPFTPGGKKALELALREAVAMGHNYIGTEHVLLGVARADEGGGAGILRARGVDPEQLYDEVLRWLSGKRAPGYLEPEADDLELTCPPLAPEVLAELERLARAERTALDRKAHAVAAAARDAERRLRFAATELVREWQRHAGESG